MYTLDQICDMIDRMNDAKERREISTEVKDQMDLEQTIQELNMHLAEN